MPTLSSDLFKEICKGCNSGFRQNKKVFEEISDPMIILRKTEKERKSKFVLGLADQIVVASELIQTSVVESGGEIELIEKIPNPIDIGLVKGEKPEIVADIVYSRRLDKDSNLQSLLLALAELRGVKWKAAIIGDGEMKEMYERQVRDLRISRRVEFLGEVPI